MLSKLIPQVHIEHAKFRGVLAQLEGRCTGATTGEMLCLIGEAMLYPRCWVKIEQKTPAESRHAYTVLDDLVEKLEFKHFTYMFSGGCYKIKYDPFY